MQTQVATALQLHQAGQLERASQLYQQVLAGEPDNADALHFLGLLRHQQGDHRQALALIGRAAALSPNEPDVHLNLGEVYRTVGEFAAAVDCAARRCGWCRTTPMP